MRIAALLSLPGLIEELRCLASAFDAKAEELADVAKSGRTHLQDAVPVTLGQEFSGYAEAIRRAADQIDLAQAPLRELGLGGSATGTGLNTKPGYRGKVVAELERRLGLGLRPAGNLFEAMQSMRPFVRASSALRGAAVELGRVSNDLRLLSSGPTTGLAEIRLPAVQPGSSIMPGKVNPVVAECMNMICFQVIGNDAVIAAAASAGQLELNVMMPVIAYDLLWSVEILTNGCRMLARRCVEGVEADREKCARFLASTIGLATVLNPVIGYQRASEVAKEAARRGLSIREVVLERGILDEDEFDSLVRGSLGAEE
jgi:aspartate ammonia-lyase